MSTIATTWVLDRDDLGEVLAAARYAGADTVWDLLLPLNHTTLRWSGRVMADVATFLWVDHNIVPVASELHGESTALTHVIGPTHLMTPIYKCYLDKINPQAYRDEELLEHFVALGYAPDKATTAPRDALAILHDGISSLAENQVLLVFFG